jgi:DNA-binding NtrC family response regulator
MGVTASGPPRDMRTRVLVVDDDRRMVKTISDILEVKGYEALEAYTGEDAVEKVRSARPDCVLMDIKMPDINGVEALKMIREISPKIPVVLMSAYPTADQIMEAKDHGACTVLTKPIDIQMVLSFLSLLRKEESILIVDDDPHFCSTLKDILEARDYRVQTEINPARVMDRMAENYKLVVLLDLKLGDENGLNVLKSIRDRYPSKPVILVTAYGAEMASSIEKGLQIGAYACLYKPFGSDVLIGHIEEISRRKKRGALGEPF